ncbi:MAG TPA: O-acetylhomoserine aminocarboxypropyltransferase/cysteine synthase [Candidatus Scatomonas merdigallinarum]|nr:O-acetylhomoserine aminocarboxypropyltransferase/cysteine synthase [Candidatus Scatomonas merdigallinarum]
MGLKVDSICLQGGWQPKNGEPRMLPIYQSTTYKYDTSEEMGALFDLEKEGYFYSRLQNPTCDVVASKICQLEGGAAAMLTSSGQAATMLAITNICEAGDHVICGAKCYGGTSNLLTVTLKRFGLETTLVDQDAPAEELEKAFRPNTKAVFAETISNPAGVILDIEKFVKLAHDHGVPMICDNTFATPINCRPFEWGVDIVTHSTTKYMDGHAMAVGGAIVDSGNFDWMAHKDKFPGLTTPDESYHGIVYAEKFGKAAYITKATAQLMRDMGACQSPQNAFLTNIGLETLHLRVPRHCENATKVAAFLKNHPKVAWVEYAGLPGDKYYDLAQKYMPKGVCGVLCFGPKGGRDGALRFTNALKMVAIETHVADAKSCVLHPASHTHRQLNDEQLAEAGVLPDLIRLSVGIEDADDIIADLDQALQAV